MSKPFAWSFSALNSFETCPWRHYKTRVSKQTNDPMGIDAILGIDGHKALELRAKDGVPLPSHIHSKTYDGLKEGKMSTDGWENYVSRIIQAPGKTITETQVALNKNFQPVKWFAKDAWVRGVIDIGKILGTRMKMFDWKTGKRKEDIDQLTLFAGLCFAKWPEVEQVDTAYIWLPAKKVDPQSFTRDQIPEIWNLFLPRVKRMEIALTEHKFPKKPSGLCKKWCPVHDCEHNGFYKG
jgi:hypothetical protein